LALDRKISVTRFITLIDEAVPFVPVPVGIHPTRCPSYGRP
jgi:hypothetical protein